MKNNTPWTFCIHTFGCKVNQYESQSIREAWINLDGQEVATPNTANIILLNTCAITANALADLRQMMNKIQKESPNAKIILTGCATELTEEYQQNLSGAYKYISQKNKTQLLNSSPLEIFGQKSLRASSHGFPKFSIHTFYRSRPIIKIQDGCSHSCAYCIIPQTRGRPYSRSPKECLTEIRTLFAAGFREVILSGINLRQYKSTLSGCKDFWDLFCFLDHELASEWKNTARLRISSLDPAQLTERSFDILSKSTMICPQLHISVQSGSAEILKNMHRSHYTPNHLRTIANNISMLWPIFGLGADIIMGFPGETNQHVQETLDIINELPLTYAHVFPFSARPGTKAATLPNQVDKFECHKRTAKVRQHIVQKQQAFQKKLMNVPVLHIAPEGNGSKNGVDEYSTHCKLLTPIYTRQILKVRPTSITKTGLLVEKIQP